jgi:hypothetical protein
LHPVSHVNGSRLFRCCAAPVKPTPQGCGPRATLTSFAIAVYELATGRFARRSETSVSTLFGYCFVCPPDEANSQRIKALRITEREAALSAADPW